MEDIKTSSEWVKSRDGLTVLDPDGWDRKNYEYSWFQEEITEDEFNQRLFQSTCLINKNI